MKDPKNILILVLLAAGAFLLGHALSRDTAHGQGYPGGTADSNGRMIAVTGTVGSGVSVLYVIDTETGNLAVYQCKGGKSIALVAARNIEWDLKIQAFHDESLYAPKDLKKLVFDQEDSGGAEGTRPGLPGPDKGSGSSPDKEVEEK
ncbi:MAG: hypothetical protein ABFS86_18390 [Planctomycetota bacterium]